MSTDKVAKDFWEPVIEKVFGKEVGVCRREQLKISKGRGPLVAQIAENIDRMSDGMWAAAEAFVRSAVATDHEKNPFAYAASVTAIMNQFFAQISEVVDAAAVKQGVASPVKLDEEGKPHVH